MTDADLSALDPLAVYSALLIDGGAILGTLIYPTHGESDRSLGGYKILHALAQPRVSRGHLHFFTIDAGRSVFEVLLPLNRVQSLYRFADLDEAKIASPADPLWSKLGPEATWDLPIEKKLLIRSTELIKAKQLKYRSALEVPFVGYFPHPLKFPRYAQFTPRQSQVIYVDPTDMERWMRAPVREEELISLFRSQSTLPLAATSNVKPGEFIFVEGAIGFFDPQQKVQWRGHAAELVAVTSSAFALGQLGDMWILGCMREEHLLLFRESVERISCSYRLCGEWREIGPFETEYGTRTNALIISAAVYIERNNTGGEPRYRVSVRSEHPLPAATIMQRPMKTIQYGNETDRAPARPSRWIFDDENGNLIVQGTSLFMPSDARQFLKQLRRLYGKLNRPVTVPELRAAMAPRTFRSVRDITRVLPGSVAELITYDVEQKGWLLKTPVEVPSVFISYCRDNLDEARRLVDQLMDSGFDVWWDQLISIGMDWKLAISDALGKSEFVIFCLSQELQGRRQSGVFPELQDAIDRLRLRPPNSVYLLIAKLSECETPPMRIYGSVSLTDLQSIKLYPEESDWRTGVAALTSAIISEAARLDAAGNNMPMSADSKR